MANNIPSIVRLRLKGAHAFYKLLCLGFCVFMATITVQPHQLQALDVVGHLTISFLLIIFNIFVQFFN